MDTADWYADYYERRGADRNDPLTNPGVLFQNLAYDAALTRALRRLPATTVLDVGCGNGNGLLALLRLGFDPKNLAGIELLEDRVAECKGRLPHIDVRAGDAAHMPYGDDAFDVVFESTMFAQLPDGPMATNVAAEMRRVAGRFVVLADWRFSHPFEKGSTSLPRARVERLFPGMKIVAIERGALVPPVGRWLSAHLPSVYFPAARLLPFLSGQVVYVLAV